MRKLTGYGPSLVVLATSACVLLLGPGAVKLLTYKQAESRMIQAANRLERNNILAELNQAQRDIAEFVEPSVVHISAQQPPGVNGTISSLSSGSGWIYDSDGHVVTNYHVVKDADRIEVQLYNGELRGAEIVGFDKSTDIAVLKIDAGHLHAAVIADSDQAVHQGDVVFAFGSPFDFRFSMSSGVVSGKGRSVDALGPSGYENFIQVDAAINPGNSGGPLTDFQGRVIGMNTAIATGRRGSLEEGQFAGIGLAIPLAMIHPVVTQIIEKGVVEKGFLGVTVAELDRAFRERLGFVGDGVRVRWLEPRGPAERAGLLIDDIVTAVDGASIGSVSQLRSMISSKLPGDVSRLDVWRAYSESTRFDELTIDVRLTRLDPIRARGELPVDQSRERIPQLGIAQMADVSPETAARYGMSVSAGVVIERTVPETELSLQIVPGATITEVMGNAVTNVEDFMEALRGHNLLSGVRIGVILPPDGRYKLVLLRVQRQR